MSAAEPVVVLSVAPLEHVAGATRREREREGARRLLAMMTGCADAAITHLDSGAPAVEAFPHLHISVSHSADAVAVALSADAPVGVDIEPPSPRVARVVPRVMRGDEPPGIDPLRAWTAKEAVFKCAAGEAVVLSDVRLLDVGATEAVTPQGSRFAVHHSAPGLAVAVRCSTGQ